MQVIGHYITFLIQLLMEKLFQLSGIAKFMFYVYHDLVELHLAVCR